MVNSIVSTSKPYTLDNEENVKSEETQSNIDTTVEEDKFENTKSTYSTNNTKASINKPITPIKNIISNTSTTDNTDTNTPTINTTLQRNPHINNVVTDSISNQNRSDLSILRNWQSSLQNNAYRSNFETTRNDPASKPLSQRELKDFITVNQNADGTYSVSTVGYRSPDSTETVGRGVLVEKLNLNPEVLSYASAPLDQYKNNYSSYDTKGKIMQGGLTLSNSYSYLVGENKNPLDNYSIREWTNMNDMSNRWGNRASMNDTISGLEMIYGVASNNNIDFGEVKNVNALYTFGKSLNTIADKWDTLSDKEQSSAALQTMVAYKQAFENGNTSQVRFGSTEYLNIGKDKSVDDPSVLVSNIKNKGNHIGKNLQPVGGAIGAAVGTVVGAYFGGPVGASVGGTAGYFLGQGEAYLTGIKIAMITEGASQFGKTVKTGWGQNRHTAEDRANGFKTGGASMASMMAGWEALIGDFGFATTSSAYIIGGTIGFISNLGKTGHSREQYHRELYKNALTQTGIFEQAAKGTANHGQYYYQLANGDWYNVGIDGHSGRATDIHGTTKTVYNRNLVAEYDLTNVDKIGGEVRPYDIDYTCDLDYTGSLLLAPLNALGLGGSNFRDAQEYAQMLGYMTNACTSNCGREFSEENYKIMVSNIKAGYERVGITNKTQAANALSLMWAQGKLLDRDLDSAKLALNLTFDKNGYNQASSLMNQLGRTTTTTTTDTTTQGGNE